MKNRLSDATASNESRLNTLFSGLDRAHGEFRETGKHRDKDGKVEGRAKTVEGPLTADDWKAHLAGEYGVGAVPITDEGTCAFAAIDFDHYNEYTVKRFVADAKCSGFPFVWCKSKSGGAHLYLFFTEPAPAVTVRKKLSELAHRLGHPKVEVFPKQNTLDVEQRQVGNWINLPYFNAKYTARYAFDDDSQPIADPEAFLDYAENRRITPEAFEALTISKQEIPFSDAPPCIQQMAHAGVGDGERNKSLFQFAIFAKKKYDDDWEEKVLEWNSEYFAPGLPFKEIQSTIFKSLSGDKEYGYLCKEPVCSEVCNKPLCQTRAFGIAGAMVQVWEDWEVTNPIILVPPVPIPGLTQKYFQLELNGQTMTFRTDEILSNKKFRAKVFEAIYKMPPNMNNNMWDQMVQHWFSEKIEAVNTADPAALTWYKICDWLSLYVDNGWRGTFACPVIADDGYVEFQLETLQNYLGTYRGGELLTKQWDLIALIKHYGAIQRSSRRHTPETETKAAGDSRRVWAIHMETIENSGDRYKSVPLEF